MREMYQQTLPPQFLYLFIPLVTTLGIHQLDEIITTASSTTLFLFGLSSNHHAPYRFRGNLSSMHIQLSFACRINPLRWHICLSWFSIDHTALKMSHTCSPLCMLFFLSEIQFLFSEGYCYHPSSALSPVFPLYCYPQYSYWYVCPLYWFVSSMKARAGSRPFFWGGGVSFIPGWVQFFIFIF